MFLFIDKPKGITSHDVIDEVRKITGEKKVGHAGTLDPNATGLLIVGVGRESTKRLGKIAKGIMLFAIAYTTHRISPVINAKFHNKDISLVDLVLKALIICGASAIATINPAK